MKRTVYLMIGGLLLASGAAYAEMIQGTVASVDPSNHQICIQPSDVTKGLKFVQFKNDTRTMNVASPQDLQVGQEVKVDAKKGSNNQLEAKSIEVTATPLAQAASQPISVPDSTSPGANKQAY